MMRKVVCSFLEYSGRYCVILMGMNNHGFFLWESCCTAVVCCIQINAEMFTAVLCKWWSRASREEFPLIGGYCVMLKMFYSWNYSFQILFCRNFRVKIIKNNNFLILPLKCWFLVFGQFWNLKSLEFIRGSLLIIHYYHWRLTCWEVTEAITQLLF